MKAIEQYFNYLKEAGADVPSTADSFKKTLSDKNSAEQYYGYLKQNNFDAPDSFDSFAKTLGITKSPTVPVKKKDGSEPLSIDTPSVSGLNQEDPIPSVSALLKQRKKLKAEKSAPKPTSAPGFPLATVETAPTIDYDAEISKIDEQIKSKGYNPRELDIEFSEYDFDLDDNKFGEFYANYKKRPLSTLRDLSSRGWGQAVRGVISRNEDETKRMEDNANFNRLAEVGAKLPKQDLNTAINWGRNAISETIALTAPDGESRDVALNNLKNGFLPVLGQVALRDKNFTSQPNLPLQFGLLSADLFDKNYADDSRAILAQDLSGNPDASQARDRRRYELEQRGLSMMQSAIGEEYEQQSDMLNKWGEWQKNNLDKLGELGQKIAAANPEIKAAVDSANKEIAGINKSIERAGLDLKTQEQIVSEYKEDYESGATSRAVYAAEVKKYNSMVEQYNSSISQAKSNIEQIKKTADEKSASSGVSPDDVKEYNKLYSEYESLSEPRNIADKFNSWASYLSKAQNNLIKNNPTVLADRIEMQLQEEDGENVNSAERFMLGIGSLVPKAADAFEIIYDAIALSPDKKREKDWRRLGRSQSDQLLMFYEREKDRVQQSPIITVVPDSIKKRIADINANNNLNDAEKEQAKREALRQGFISGQIYQATNPNAGKINITAKSILNSAVTVIPQILAAAGLSYITGGVGAGVAVSTFLNGYSSYYNDAISKSIANPNQYAFAHSLVDYATEMIGTADLKLIQNALKGNKGVGAKFFKDLTDGEFKSLLAGSKNAFKNTGKAFVKNALINAGETGEEIGAQVGGNIIDQELFGEKKPTTEGITETILTTSLGQMPLTLLGVPLSVNRNNIANKYALYNAATDVNGTMAFLKKELEAGNINSQEYTDRVKLVNDYAKAIKETPATYADGNPMRDDDKAKYAFNQFISNMKADKSPLPPQQKQNVDQVIADAENENDKILSNATNQSQVQEGRTEGDLGQPQGIVQGQPEVGQGAGSQGQTQITPANVGDSNIGGQGQVVAPELSKTESLTPDQIEVTEDATGFADQMASAQASLGSTGVSVTPYTQESYDEIASQGGKFLRAVGNKVLAVLKPNGEMVSLVKDATVKAKGAAQALITKMKDMGGLFMDNYDIYLTPIYQKAGYRVVARVPFDEQYAPEGWNNEDSPLKNKPDVVFMVRNDIAPDQEQSFATYEEAQNYTQGLVDQAVNSGAAKLPTQVTKIDKVLNETIPMATQALEQSGVKFQVVDPATDTEQARAARGNQGLFRSEDGTIIIDKSKLADEIEAGIVVWHEASHPVMNIIRNSDKSLYDAVVRGLKQAAKKNKGVAGALNWAQSQEQYDNEDTQNDEAVVETIGRINAGLIDINSLDTGLRQKLIDFINSIAKYFGIDPILNDRDIAAFKKTVSEVADALKTGRDISEIVGQENVKNYGVPIGVPTQAKVADKYGPKVKHDGGTYKLSFVKPSDIIDIKGLIKEIADSGQKVWFWTADQLGRGMYYDNVIEGEHYLDAGPSFALDPKNRDNGVIWATGKGENWVNDKIANSDYIFIISGSPQKSKLFNKRVAEITFNRVKKSVGEEGAWDKFKSEVLGVSKIGKINEILNKYNSFEDLLASTDRKELLIQFDAQKEKKGTPLKGLLEKYGAFVDYNDLRDGFFKDNDFKLNDVMLVLKPTGYGGKSAHSTYENDILGEVVGVPDRKVNAYDIMPDEFRAKYAPDMSRTEQSQAVAPYGAGVRNVQASVGGRDLTGNINKKLTDDGQGNYVFFHYSGKKLNKIDPSKFGANLATGRDERPGVGLSMYYVDNKTLETGVPSDFGYAVRIPKDKVYPFNEDPLNFYDQAKAEFEKDYPGQAFDANKQIGYITKVAGDNGFDITVADWNIKGRKALRAQTTKSLKPEVYKQKVFKNGSEREQFNEELQKLKPGVQASVGNRGQLLAPNGKPSNLTEQQYNQVRTPEFKNWFGDWENDPENASKVVDENGEPKVVFRTDSKSFDKFKNRTGEGIFFQTNKSASELYGGTVRSFYVNAKNPKIISGLPNELNAKDIANSEFDSVINNGVYGGDEIIVIDPNQIKSATDNVGTFSTTDNRIQASVGNRSEEDLRADGTGKERPRALASKYGNLNPATQAKIEDDATVYFQRTNKQTKEAVDKFLDGLNIMDAADYVLSNPKIPEVSQVWMAAEVAKRLNAEIDAAGNNQDLKDDLTRKQADIFNEFAKRATSLGQAVQAFIAFKDNANAVEFFLPKVLRQLKKAGVENVTEEQRADILTMLKDVNTAAEGLPKDKAIIKLSHYLAGIAPLKPMDVLQAIWYAKILSGITTQSTNFFANIFNTVFELPAVALRISLMNGTPLGLAAGVKGFGSGVAKGAVAAADIIKSGVRSKEVDKYFAENPLEYFTWSKWLGNKGKVLDYIPPLNFGAWKYVGRILAATDALFATANQEAIANMLAYAEAAGTPAGNNFKKANAILGNNKMSVLRARAQAKAEGFEPGTIQYKRRELEIIAQKRTGTQEADEIGKRITMNYDPEGFTKPIFDAVVALQRTIPAIKMVIPFARIVANLTENGLNYSPLGFAKAATGIKNPFQGLKSERLSTEQRVDLFAKFAIGMSTLAVLASKVGEDEDDWFEITAGGSPDVQKKYELQEGKWRPYTITLKDGTKISYKDWPIAGILAGVGHLRDAKNYSFDDSTQMGLYGYGFFLNMYDKSLLSGLQDFFGIFNVSAGRGKYAPDTKASERAIKYAAQQVKSVALSNLSQQSFKLYSELVTGDPQRDAKTFAQLIYRDIPSLNDGIRPIINVFGDEVKYTTSERLLPVMDSPEGEEIIEWLNKNKLFIGVPMKKNIKLLDGTERPMTDAEYYEYRKNAGKGVKKFINEFLAEIKDKEIGEEAFEKVVSAARQEAYAEILMKANNL